MTDDATPSPAPRRRSPNNQPWPVAAGLHVLERYGVSTLALGALAWFTATYMIRPLVDAAKSSMESVADKVAKIEEIFRESEAMEREVSARSTAAIEAIKTEISIHRQQASELRDGVLTKVLDAQERQFSRHQSDMERILRDAIRSLDAGECAYPQVPVKGIVGDSGGDKGGG